MRQEQCQGEVSLGATRRTGEWVSEVPNHEPFSQLLEEGKYYLAADKKSSSKKRE